MFGRYRSFIGTNDLLCCNRYNWSLSELNSNPEHIKCFSLNVGILMVYLTFIELIHWRRYHIVVYCLVNKF